MIDKADFKAQLQKILDEKYSSRAEYERMSYYAVEPRVRTAIAEYVQKKYASYYSDRLVDLLKERDALLVVCLAELGVKK